MIDIPRVKILYEGDMNYRSKIYRNDESGDVISRLNEMGDCLNITMHKKKKSSQSDVIQKMGLEI